MAYVIIALIGLAAWFFLYEGIMAPHLRMGLRIRMFELRDELRNLSIEDPDLLQSDSFNFVHESITVMLNRIHLLDLSTSIKAFDEIDKDPKLRDSIDRRRKIIDESPNPRIKEIAGEMYRILGRALVVNSGGWLVFVVPIAVAIVLLHGGWKRINDLLGVSRGDAERIMPADLSEEGRYA